MGPACPGAAKQTTQAARAQNGKVLPRCGSDNARLAAPFPTPTNRTFDLATGAETTTSPNAFSTQLFGNGNVVLSPVDRWTLELPLAENPWFMSVSPTDIAEFDGGELADAILSLEFLSTT